jgi:putative membrane protein
MEELHTNDKYRQHGVLVLDVRTQAEYRRGHVPGSRNIPCDEIARNPRQVSKEIEPFARVFVYCSSGHRSGRAYDLLAQAGAANVVHVRDSGMPDWARQGYRVEREISLGQDLVTGILAGVLADVAVAGVDQTLARFVTAEQKRREKEVREASPHAIAGTKIGERITGRQFSRPERHKAQLLFNLGYGIVFGLVYALVRRRLPRATSLLGLPFGAAFFLGCDGFLAPLFKMTPGLQKIPWQFNAKEMANHIAWTATAEVVHRAGERVARKERTG